MTRSRSSADQIERLVITTHWACAALLDSKGDLAAPVLDYEHTGPDATRAAFDANRLPFAETV
jgi:sugar (pentulose or hexulose) kinase